MSAPYVTCHHCNGNGLITLAEPLLDTLRQFGARSKFSAGEIERGARITINAMNNRLEKLRRYGFLERTRDGRNWMYELSKSARVKRRNAHGWAKS